MNIDFSTNPHRITCLCRHFPTCAQVTTQNTFHAVKIAKDPNQPYHLVKELNDIFFCIISDVLTTCVTIAMSPAFKTDGHFIEITNIVE